MQLRRALATVAASAVIAPVAVLAAPAAYATEETTPSPSATATSTPPEPTEPKPDEPKPDEPTSEAPSPSATESETAKPTDPAEPTEPAEPTGKPSASQSSPAEPTPSATASESSKPTDEPTDPAECADTKVDVDIKGLPGKIAAGSGWHKFRMTVANNSESTLRDLFFLAGASADKSGQQIFKNRQVELQAYNPVDKVWENIGSDGYAVGFVGWTDELKPQHVVDIPMRLNVKASAPVGAGFSLGGSVYSDDDAKCVGFGEVAYRFQIVAAGTNTGGTKPQEGGRVPVTDEKPSKADASKVTGTLAETGASSQLPVIALIGGVTVLAGAGVVFAMRRRKSEGAAA